MDRSHDIIVVGASAERVEALTNLVSHLSPDLPQLHHFENADTPQQSGPLDEPPRLANVEFSSIKFTGSQTLDHPQI